MLLSVVMGYALMLGIAAGHGFAKGQRDRGTNNRSEPTDLTFLAEFLCIMLPLETNGGWR